jgi:hypothetical protein
MKKDGGIEASVFSFSTVINKFMLIQSWVRFSPNP